MRIFGYGSGYDQQAELCQSSSTAIELLEAFVDEIIMCFGDDYLPLPTVSEVRRILSMSAARSFPGCIGSRDYQHWF